MMQEHEAAALFPPMSKREFEALVVDIKENGQREPIITLDGKILDGRHRWRACEQLGMPAETMEWQGKGSPIAFVASMNLHRRHLNESQRALIAAKLATLKYGQRADLAMKKTEALHKCSSSPPLSAGAAAKLLNIGEQTVFAAKTVLARGTPEEIRAAEAGEIAVVPLARQIRQGVTPGERAAHRSAPLAATGRNPERIQRQQLNAKLYRDVREAVMNLTSLPSPAQVVAIVRAHDRGVVEPKLDAALSWLKEFCNEWRREKAAA
jgi:hypothetical protein